MRDLKALKDEANRLHEAFRASIRTISPELDKWHWYRALAAERGENCRHNDDKRFDRALASSATIRADHDAYLAAIHAFYSARDGENGFLGSRDI